MSRIVVDTNVASSAKDPASSQDQLAVACHDALVAIETTPTLSLALSSELIAEWVDPRTGQWMISWFALGWLNRLIQQHRTETVVLPGDAVLAAAVTGLPQNDRSRATKDVHLVELALATDERILSHEKNARHAFQRAIPDDARLAALHWVSPVEPDCVAWLQQGAPDEPRYHLIAAATW